jgi:hypothetical protein
MKSVPSNGSLWPLVPLNELNQTKDMKDALAFKYHKGADKQQDVLQKLVKDNVNIGFALPLPFNKTKLVLGILLAPLNIQLQKTKNEHREFIQKNRLMHDQSWKCQSGMSVNSRVDKDKLMPCYFGKALKCLINRAVIAKKLHPKKRSLATKLDPNAAFQQCHLNTSMALQTCTQLSSKLLTLMMLRRSFGRAPCPSE